MTSPMPFPSFPWPKWSCCSQSIVKTIYYSRYFPTLWRIKYLLVFIFLLELTGFLTCLLFFQLFIFCLFILSSFSVAFHDLHFNFRTFQALENEIIIQCHDFPAFPLPIRTLKREEKTTVPWHKMLTPWLKPLTAWSTILVTVRALMARSQPCKLLPTIEHGNRKWIRRELSLHIFIFMKKVSWWAG